MTAFSIFLNYHLEFSAKLRFLELKQIEGGQEDIKKTLQILPEGIMIYKRFGNPHIKLWNKELVNIFRFKALQDESIGEIEDLNTSHMKDILSQKTLLPIPRVKEKTQPANNFENPILHQKPISIETALIFGEADRFYQVIDTDGKEMGAIVGLHVSNITFDEEECSMITFRNWTENFKHQFAKSEQDVSEMVSTTLNTSLRDPMSEIIINMQTLVTNMKQSSMLPLAKTV